MMEMLPLELLLLEYAAGSLGASESLVVALHLALNPQSRRKVSAYESVGGGLIEEERPAPLPSSCLEAVLRRIDTPAAQEPIQEGHAREPRLADVPAPFRGMIAACCSGDDGCWSRVAAGVEKMDLRVSGGAASGSALRLMRLGPAQSTPRHAHRGREITLVLEGGYTDEFGHFGRGDIEIILDPARPHTPVADAEGCLCLTLTEAPLRFSDPLARLMNLFRQV